MPEPHPINAEHEGYQPKSCPPIKNLKMPKGGSHVISRSQQPEPRKEESVMNEDHLESIWNSRRIVYAELDTLALWPRPIPVSEKLPEIGIPVMCYVPGAFSYFENDPKRIIPGCSWLRLSRESDGWYRCYGTQFSPDSVTHWLPMPPKP